MLFRSDPVVNSAHEQIRGPQAEFDVSRPTIKIEQNRPLLELELWAPMLNTVNNATLWGAPRGCVKLSNVSWEKLYHGQCGIYYKRTFEFDVWMRINPASPDPQNPEIISGFDRTVLDEGTKMLNGHWTTSGLYSVSNIAPSTPPDPHDPSHFVRAIDRKGNPIKMILNGHGLPASVFLGTGSGTGTTGRTGDPGFNTIEYYPESDFTRLGIPLSLSI